MQEASSTAASFFGIQAASEWGGDFQFSDAMRNRDVSDLADLDYDLEQLCLNRHEQRRPSHISRDRVQSCLRPGGANIYPLVTDIDFDRIMDLAENGMRVMTPSGFTPISTPPPFRPGYEQVAAAVHRGLADQWEAGTILLIPTETAMSLPQISFGCQHWAPKKGKEQGRIICDISNCHDQDDIPLNGDFPHGRAEIRDACADEWGDIVFPTIDEVILQVLFIQDEYGIDDIMLWQMDLSGAFTLLGYAAESS
jgi:hypothetical protein